MTLDQFESLQGSLITVALTVAVAFGVLVWDYFNLLPDEIKLYATSDKKLWRTPATWAFCVLRYSGILATLPSLFFTSIQSDHCQAAVVISQVGVVLVVGASGIIFCYRVIAIWNGSKVIYAVVGVMYLAMLGCWCAVASQYQATTGPHTPFGSNCQMLPIVAWAPISYASSVAFDAVILLLTIFKLNTNRATASKVGYLIYRDSLMYFFFTAVTNITVLVIQALDSSFDLVKPTAVPFSTLITATMGARVFLNLKLFNQRQANANQGLPFSASMSSSRGDRSINKPPSTPTPTPFVRPVQAYELNSPKSEAPFSTYAPPKVDRSFEMDDFIQQPVRIVH